MAAVVVWNEARDVREVLRRSVDERFVVVRWHKRDAKNIYVVREEEGGKVA